MRTLFCLGAVLVTFAPLVQAQMDYYARLGASYSTALVEDRIADEQISIAPKIAPLLAIGAAFPIAPRYRAGLEATLTTSGYQSSNGGADADLGTLRTGTINLGLDGPVVSRLRWRAGVGLINYWPSPDRGIFLQGGTRRFLAGAGLDFRRAVNPKWDLMASLRYDMHRFTTDELRRRGFGQDQGVHRVALSVGISRGGNEGSW